MVKSGRKREKENAPVHRIDGREDMGADYSATGQKQEKASGEKRRKRKPIRSASCLAVTFLFYRVYDYWYISRSAPFRNGNTPVVSERKSVVSGWWESEKASGIDAHPADSGACWKVLVSGSFSGYGRGKKRGRCRSLLSVLSGMGTSAGGI